jgi:CRP/FNR family cyclic AMP-dependent transcriptional regulator
MNPGLAHSRDLEVISTTVVHERVGPATGGWPMAARAAHNDGTANVEPTTGVQRLDLEKGAVLCEEGAPERWAYRLESGLAVRVRTGHGQVMAPLGIVGPGEMIGESALLSESVCDYTAYTLTSTRTSRIDGTATKRSGLVDVTLPLLAVLASRVRTQQDYIARLHHQSTSTRLAHLLIELASLQAEQSAFGPKYSLSSELSQVDIAKLIGSSRETVNKGLTQFESRGWLKRTASRWLIFPERGLSAHGQRGAPTRPGQSDPQRALRVQRELCSLIGFPPAR